MAALITPSAALAGASPQQLVRTAIADVQAADPACLPAPALAPGAGSFSDDPPSAALLEALGVLRRAATADDAAAVERVARLGVLGAHRGWIHAVATPEGVFDVVPVTVPPRFLSPRCAAAERRRLAQLVRPRTRIVRARALRALARVQATRRAAGPVEHVLLFHDAAGAYGGGGTASLGSIRAGRATIVTGGGPSGDRSVVATLVPDAITAVTWRFTNGSEFTAPVTENLAVGVAPFAPPRLGMPQAILRRSDPSGVPSPAG